jgi:hypothetical protein
MIHLAMMIHLTIVVIVSCALFFQRTVPPRLYETILRKTHCHIEDVTHVSEVDQYFGYKDTSTHVRE